MLYVKSFSSPIGTLHIVRHGEQIVRLILPNSSLTEANFTAVKNDFILDNAANQLADYFNRTRTTFSLPLLISGTPFQRNVWQQPLKIPYCKTVSYGKIAEQLGCQKGGRAVGQANKVNPLPIFVPCHRVINSDGSIGGYYGGEIQ